MILFFSIEKYCACFAAPFSSGITPALPSSHITKLPISLVPVIHHSTANLITETQSSTQFDDVKNTPSVSQPSSTILKSTISSEKSTSDSLLDSVGQNNSTSSMTGSNSEYIYVIVESVVGLVIVTCGIILMVAIGLFSHQYRKNVKEKYQHETSTGLHCFIHRYKHTLHSHSSLTTYITFDGVFVQLLCGF